MKPITMQEALDAVSERYCKGHHYENVALSDEMVRRICEVKSLVNMGFIATAITDAALQASSHATEACVSVFAR